jgi:3-oxoacyl-[acyl-carrier-protein] synthase II
MTSPKIPVAVTGLGAVTPLGGDVPSFWSGLLAGRSGVGLLDEEWAADLPVRLAATVDVDLVEALTPAKARVLDRVQQLALLSALEAWADAGTPEVAPDRLAVVVGTGIGGVITLLAAEQNRIQRGPRRVSPFTVPMLMPNASAATVALRLGAMAGVHAPVAACASGAEAVAMGLQIIREGRADVVVCGGTEAAVNPLPLAAFAAMRALSTRQDEPAAASRPFDKARDGFVLGEGAGMLVLESAEFAAARGATPHAFLAGAGQSADAHHVAAPHPEGAGAALAIAHALADAGAQPDDIVHVNAHATSTPLGDIAESKALHATLGPDVCARAAVSATKSTTGHLLGAAGAVEAIAAVLALREHTAPHIRNLDDPDDEVAALDLVRVEPRTIGAGAALSNSFGFGGHNVSLVFRSAEVAQ